MKKRISIMMALMIILLIILGTSTLTAMAQQDKATRIEAEQALLPGNVTTEEYVEASGGKMVTYVDHLADSVIFKAVPAAKRFAIGYTRGNTGNGKLSLYINDIYIQDINFLYTGGWGSSRGHYKECNLDVSIPDKADVKLQFDDGDAAVNIDYIDLYESGVFPTPTPIPAVALPNPKQARIDIVKGMQKYASEINISKYNLTLEDVMAIRTSITLYSEPTLYCVHGTTVNPYDQPFKVGDSEVVSAPDGYRTIITSVMPLYTTTKEDYFSISDRYETAVKKMLATIPKNASDIDKVVLVNDYIASIAIYSSSIPSKNCSLGTFLNGGGQCKSYTMAFIDGMNRLGIENKYIAGNDNKHAWAMVKIDNEWYHVDPTWDDTTGNWHKYCLLSDAEMIRLGHYNWYAMIGIGIGDTAPVATSTKYDNATWKMSNEYISFTKPAEFTTIAKDKLRYEAEKAAFSGGAQMYNSSTASKGKAVGYIDTVGNSVTFVKVKKANGFTLGYSRGDSQVCTLSVYINDVHARDICFSGTDDWETYKKLNLTFDIPEGANITFRFDAGDGPINLDYMDLYIKKTLPPQTISAAATKYTTLKNKKLRFEGEDAVFTGDGRVYADYPKASKGKVAAFMMYVADSATFVKTPKAKGFTICYTKGTTGTGTVSLYINNVHKKDITFPNTGGYGANSSDYKTLYVPIDIPKGANIKFQVDEGDAAINIDYIDLTVSK